MNPGIVHDVRVFAVRTRRKGYEGGLTPRDRATISRDEVLGPMRSIKRYWVMGRCPFLELTSTGSTAARRNETISLLVVACAQILRCHSHDLPDAL